MFSILKERGADANDERPALDGDDGPLDDFSRCHEGIVEQLRAFALLPELSSVAQRAREVAAATVALFENGVLAHHGDEESELFPAVVRWARPGLEQERAKSLVQRLTLEHRQIEALWKQHRRAVTAVARGRSASLEKRAAIQLVQAYIAHAQLEEQEFLPLAREVLGRDGARVAALGMSLHLRHAPHIAGYV